MLTVGVERLQIVLIFGVGEIYKNHVGGIVVGDHYCNRSDIKRNIGRPRIVGISLSVVSIAAAALLAGCSQSDGSGFGDMEPAAANSEDIDRFGSSEPATSHTNPAEELFSERKAIGSTRPVPEENRSGKGEHKDRPLWERPEVLAKYPVKAKKNPDGSYDYSDPRFENADLCEDAPPGYWEGLGYRSVGSDYIKFRKLKNCGLVIMDRGQERLIAAGTDSLPKNNLAGRIFREYSPYKYDQINEMFGVKACVSYLETPLGRVGVTDLAEFDPRDFKELCDDARSELERLL